MLVSLANLKSYMGGLTLTPEQEAITETEILPGVQQELETHCDRPLEVVHIRETRPVDDRGYVVFSVTPVWKINFIRNMLTGQVVTLPTPPPPPDDLPPFVAVGGMRNLDKTGTGLIGLPYEYPVQASILGSPYGALQYGLLGAGPGPDHYVCDYEGGWKGFEEQGLDLAIMRVAAREVERQFDDTFSIRGGTQDSAQDSDSRLKYWDQDELIEWDRLRRRRVV